MKRCISVILLTAVLLVMLACCSVPVEDVLPESFDTLSVFPEIEPPHLIVKTQSYWVNMVNRYGDSNYTLSVSSYPEEINPVYSASGVSIWCMEANDFAITWCEVVDDTYTYYAFDIAANQLTKVYQTESKLGFQLRNVGIYHTKVYYAYMDYEKETAGIYSYDLSSGETELAVKVPFQGDRSVMSFALQGQYLSIASYGNVMVMDLQSNKTVHSYTLEDSVTYVFSVSYDPEHKTCALYYCDEDSEDIGILGTDGQLASMYSFAKSHYAYHDHIVCRNGHIYWITQANISGNVSDHYWFNDYDYLQHKAVTVKRTFGFHADDIGVYILSYDKDGYFENILLSKYGS